MSLLVKGGARGRLGDLEGLNIERALWTSGIGGESDNGAVVVEINNLGGGEGIIVNADIVELAL